MLLAATGAEERGKLLRQGSSAGLDATPMLNVTQMNAKRSNSELVWQWRTRAQCQSLLRETGDS